MKAAGIGIVGCGNISGIYVKNLTQLFESVSVAACADLDPLRAEEKAAEAPGAVAQTIDELCANPDVEIVLNLTPPGLHYVVAKQALDAGKHVYSEKPLTLTRDEGRDLLKHAGEKGLRVGCAPDTFMGAGIQTCRTLIEDGAIGEVIGAQAFMLSHGPDHWHPNPGVFYQVGGGPMFDMGPYYLTTLVALIGPMKRVTGMTRGAASGVRTIPRGERKGETIEVEVATHVSGLFEFDGGATGSLTTSFDVWASEVPRIEVFGSEGTLSVPDPNSFGGPVRKRMAFEDGWTEVDLLHPYAENSRGLGLADMAEAIADGRPHRASGELAYHVLDAMQAIHDASDTGRHVELESRCERPAGCARG